MENAGLDQRLQVRGGGPETALLSSKTTIHTRLHGAFLTLGEAEAGGLRGQPGLKSKTLSLKANKTNKQIPLSNKNKNS